ncbi:MAG: MlaD family protein, partial [Deltaproteobacteria bacterium]|nr:MlaD family protein [Deltaproteobacteria bacterium]
MKRGNLELMVGIFVLAGLACLAYLAIHLGKMEVVGSGYKVNATFDNVSGLKEGAAVEVAGVDVGRVESIRLSPGDRAQLIFRVEPGLKLNDDAIASIRTKGIIGDKFV